MAKMWTPKPIDLLLSWVEAIIEEASDELSDWESTFVTDIEARLRQGRSLTERQEEILERIYAEKTK
jgi:hypothetical protein